jgi:hypothetical protein
MYNSSPKTSKGGARGTSKVSSVPEIRTILRPSPEFEKVAISIVIRQQISFPPECGVSYLLASAQSTR